MSAYRAEMRAEKEYRRRLIHRQAVADPYQYGLPAAEKRRMNREAMARLVAMDAAEPELFPGEAPGAVTTTIAPPSRPTCPRCGQVFRRNGNGLRWHLENRPDCGQKGAMQ